MRQHFPHCMGFLTQRIISHPRPSFGGKSSWENSFSMDSYAFKSDNFSNVRHEKTKVN